MGHLGHCFPAFDNSEFSDSFFTPPVIKCKSNHTSGAICWAQSNSLIWGGLYFLWSVSSYPCSLVSFRLVCILVFLHIYVSLYISRCLYPLTSIGEHVIGSPWGRVGVNIMNTGMHLSQLPMMNMMSALCQSYRSIDVTRLLPNHCCKPAVNNLQKKADIRPVLIISPPVPDKSMVIMMVMIMPTIK